MHVCIGKRSVHRVWYYPWFQASSVGGLEIYLLRIRGGGGDVLSNPNSTDTLNIKGVSKVCKNSVKSLSPQFSLKCICFIEFSPVQSLSPV